MITAIDPVTALVVIDLQQGLVGTPCAHPIAPVIANARALADAFRARHLPVVLVNVIGGAPGRTEAPRRDMRALPADFAEFVLELGRQADDICVTKRTWGAFAGTGLAERLHALGVTQVVVAGIATATGVESTARQAYEAGFNVTLAIDAMTDTRPAAHDYAIANVFPRLGETGTTVEIITLLEGLKR